MPLCIHLGIPLSTHTDAGYEQEQIDALAELGVELRCALTLSRRGQAGWGGWVLLLLGLGRAAAG